MKKYLVLGLLAMAVLYAIPLSAAENVKIKLPDGLYMYDSWIEKLTDGGVSVRFEKCFVVKNNIIYNFEEAVKKFGVTNLNRLLTENKKYKILFGGEKIGKIYDVLIEPDGYRRYEEELLAEKIRGGPLDVKENFYFGRLGSAKQYIAVPESYKEVPGKVYNTVSKEEVDKISKLAKDKLFDLVKNRKELMQYKIKNTELYDEKLYLLDKISDRNGEFYIGIYRYVFKIVDTALKLKMATVVPAFEIVFSVEKDNIHVIASDYDNETLFNGMIKICGMLDVDGCGKEELIIEKEFPSEDEATTNLEIYKQKADGNWTQIKKIKTRRAL